MVKKILIGIGVIFFIIAVLIFRPVPIVTEDKALVEKGIVSSIYEGGVKDVVFIIEGNNRKFYINRGLENGLEINKLREKLIGKEVTFKYPRHWTPLDWNNSVIHVSKVEIKGDVIFNELKK